MFLRVCEGLRRNCSLGSIFVFSLTAVACSSSVEPIAHVFCLEDADCREPETCLFDTTSKVSYCARTGCTSDSDCPAYQECRRTRTAEIQGTELSICIDRVRACLAEESCNGLDDDCDGVVDGPSCKVISACLDDEPCGVFVCTAPENQPLALCVPPNTMAPVADYRVCATSGDCRNGVCESGICSPLCREPTALTGPTCPQGYACTRSVGPGLRPPFNVCQPICATARDCASIDPDFHCVRRDIYPSGARSAFVCARPDPDRKPIGSNCSGFGPAGHDECQSGLCFDCRCTHACHPGDDLCGDVARGAKCERDDSLGQGVFVCTSTGGVCGF